MPGFGHPLGGLPTIFGRLLFFILPEEMTTSLLGVTTFWPLSRSFDVRDVSLWLFHWQFSSLGLFAWCPIFTYVFCESVGEVP